MKRVGQSEEWDTGIAPGLPALGGPPKIPGSRAECSAGWPQTQARSSPSRDGMASTESHTVTLTTGQSSPFPDPPLTPHKTPQHLGSQIIQEMGSVSTDSG